jgi:hypothetical protein
MLRVCFGTPTTGKRDIIWFTLDRNKTVSLSSVKLVILVPINFHPSVTANSSFFTSDAVVRDLEGKKVQVIGWASRSKKIFQSAIKSYKGQNPQQ